MLNSKPAREKSAPPHPASVEIRGTRRHPDGHVDTAAPRAIANETAVEISVNGEALAVMMVTPEDLEDFAIGFAMTEGLARAASEIAAPVMEILPQGVRINLEIAGEDLGTKARTRGLEGRSGCGICGVRTLDEAMRCVPAVRPGPAIAAAAIHRALGQLSGHQRLNTLTRAVHAAAWVSVDGAIEMVREDVGRHNALDKLAGWIARNGVDTASGFCLITSRCSYEMVQKAAVMNIATVVAISAPTALAIAIAREAGMTLAAVARDDSHILFTP